MAELRKCRGKKTKERLMFLQEVRASLKIYGVKNATDNSFVKAVDRVDRTFKEKIPLAEIRNTMRTTLANAKYNKFKRRKPTERTRGGPMQTAGEEKTRQKTQPSGVKEPGLIGRKLKLFRDETKTVPVAKGILLEEPDEESNDFVISIIGVLCEDSRLKSGTEVLWPMKATRFYKL